MKTEDFQELLESVREAKQILRGEKKAIREFIVEVPLIQSMEQISFVICVQTDDPSLLVPRKPVAFPKEVEQVLAQVDA